jgi:hypothetical protein
MFDILFDITTREIVMNNNDFATTANPSVQNGGIALYSRCANLRFPMFGIGVEDLMNGDMTKAAYEMNRWQVMTKNDGADIARWSAAPFAGNQVAIQTEVSYVV